ncbi:MAG: rhodanese-like domain-containing protein [Rhodobacteraceae bacterium]|nr:rhodanese-like domain-containing protein [Paracoccaceae bacterium]MCF8515873.1 rhodanese-like domain-containing protein [Paracoccaceae bacterium]MCF8520106.1 rhodanese-like domain-containing protein [Paracoccaceae bacterium]
MSVPVPSISAPEAMALQKSAKVLMLDVRSALEINHSGTAKGAMCIPAIDVYPRARPASPKFDTKFTQAETIIVFCAVGARSEAVCVSLLRLGYQDVRNMKRFSDWVAAGGAVQAA